MYNPRPVGLSHRPPRWYYHNNSDVKCNLSALTNSVVLSVFLFLFSSVLLLFSIFPGIHHGRQSENFLVERNFLCTWQQTPNHVERRNTWEPTHLQLIESLYPRGELQPFYVTSKRRLPFLQTPGKWRDKYSWIVSISPLLTQACCYYRLKLVRDCVLTFTIQTCWKVIRPSHVFAPVYTNICSKKGSVPKRHYTFCSKLALCAGTFFPWSIDLDLIVVLQHTCLRNRCGEICLLLLGDVFDINALRETHFLHPTAQLPARPRCSVSTPHTCCIIFSQMIADKSSNAEWKCFFFSFFLNILVPRDCLNNCTHPSLEIVLLERCFSANVCPSHFQQRRNNTHYLRVFF